MVRRIYVEKKPDFAVEAQGVFADIKQNLDLAGLTGLRIVNRYDIEGIDESTYEKVKYTVFAEPAIDEAVDTDIEYPAGSFCFAVGYVPGQYDQRADSAAQCIELLEPTASAVVKFARVYILEGDITEEDVAAIKKYVINPVDSEEVPFEIPESLDLNLPEPDDVAIVEGFIGMDDEQVKAYRKEQDFAMSDGDILKIHEYFRDEEKRDPTITEMKVIDTYWSDHCRHTTFGTVLEDVQFEDSAYGDVVKAAFDEYLAMRAGLGREDKDICLMDMATIGTKYVKSLGKADDLDESEEINACSIKVKANIDGREEDWLVMFKNETHNHPTEIEPFGGAATCLGGAIRDPLSGRVYVYQAMRVTGAADPRTPVSEALEGKLPQKVITQQAAAGYSSYGNQIGLATGLVDEVYDEDYVAKRMEVGAVVGAAPADHVIRKRPEPGDVILLVGGRTGRDGLGGATGASKQHTVESINECGAEVQKGNPPIERNLQRLFRRGEAARLIKRCNDFGAGGVSVAIGELADALDIQLDMVPKKYEGLDGTELAVSESQERMAVVVAAEDEETFIKYANEENLEATTVAKVTDTGRIRMHWRGKVILDLSRDFLNTNGAKQETTVTVAAPAKGGTGEDVTDLSAYADVTDYLSDLNCASKKGLIDRFDSTIGVATVLMPLGGKYQLSPAMGMAAKLPVVEGNTTTASVMAYGYDPKLAKKSPFHGALYAVVDSVTKIGAMGGDIRGIRLTFQEYFEKLTDRTSWGKPMAALLGGLKAQKELEIPAIGGKDSMSGTFMDINVPPALLSFAITTMDSREVISTEFKATGDPVIYLKLKKDENDLPDWASYRKTMDKVRELAAQGRIKAASAVGYGGVFMAAVKMMVGNGIGVTLAGIDESDLKDRGYGSLVLELDKRENVARVMGDVPYTVLGYTNLDGNLIIEVDGCEKTLTMDEILTKWRAPLEAIFPTDTKDALKGEAAKVETAPNAEPVVTGPAIKVARPKVLIPTFPGTNCELDSKRAFDKAGADSEIFIIRNMTKEALDESIKGLVQKIKESNIIMLPGGFSGGDEPDGSAKFITAIFRNPAVSEATMDLLDNRDGLMLGICNGFQALIKLGLVPYGKIITADANCPTLTYNKIGRHQSMLVRTKVASTKSPWLAKAKVGGVYTMPVSHGEGHFICNDDVLKELIEGGQIATQYVDFDGDPTMDIAFNPNASVMAIEGITSPDGRVFGKMGHAERVGFDLYKNVDGDPDLGLFEAGVEYFK